MALTTRLPALVLAVVLLRLGVKAWRGAIRGVVELPGDAAPAETRRPTVRRRIEAVTGTMLTGSASGWRSAPADPPLASRA